MTITAFIIKLLTNKKCYFYLTNTHLYSKLVVWQGSYNGNILLDQLCMHLSHMSYLSYWQWFCIAASICHRSPGYSHCNPDMKTIPELITGYQHKWYFNCSPALYPPIQRSWKGGILVSPCPSVRLSLCGQNHVSSVSSTILIGSILANSLNL